MLSLLSEFKDKLVRDGRKPITIFNMERNIIYFSRYLGHEDMRKVSAKDIERYKLHIMTEYPVRGRKGLAEGTIQQRLLSLIPYFQFLVQNKKIFFDPTLNLKLPKREKKLPDYIPSENDIKELLQGPDVNTFLGIRDRTLIELMYTCPLRSLEMRELTLHELDMKDKFIYPKRAKGGYECGIPIARTTYEILEKYLAIARPRLARHSKKPTNRLFLTANGKPFEYGTINEILEKYKGNKRIHAHSMRHACAVHMMRHGARIRDIQVLLGHRRLTSTQLYTKLTADDIKDLQDKHHPRERKYKNDRSIRRV